MALVEHDGYGNPIGFSEPMDMAAKKARLSSLGIAWIEIPGTIDLRYQYIGVLNRPEFPISLDKDSIMADGVDAATISGVPRGTNVVAEVGGEEAWTGVCNDGEIVVRTDQPGMHRLTLTLKPYLDRVIEIVAVQPPVGSE